MRIDYRSMFPAAIGAMAGLEEAVRTSTLEPELLGVAELAESWHRWPRRVLTPDR
jgi:hypothetical protein